MRSCGVSLTASTRPRWLRTDSWRRWSPKRASAELRCGSAAGPVGFSTPAVELAVYLCCLEAMQNAAKHAGRDVDVTIRLIHDEDELQFSVEDDGRGFDPTATECSGLATMRERIAAMGGRLTVSSVRGHGTTVSGAVTWPPRTHESVSAYE